MSSTEENAENAVPSILITSSDPAFQEEELIKRKCVATLETQQQETEQNRLELKLTYRQVKILQILSSLNLILQPSKVDYAWFTVWGNAND